MSITAKRRGWREYLSCSQAYRYIAEREHLHKSHGNVPNRLKILKTIWIQKMKMMEWRAVSHRNIFHVAGPWNPLQTCLWGRIKLAFPHSKSTYANAFDFYTQTIFIDTFYIITRRSDRVHMVNGNLRVRIYMLFRLLVGLES